MKEYKPRVGEKCLITSRLSRNKEEITPRYVSDDFVVAEYKGKEIAFSNLDFYYLEIKTDEEKAIDELVGDLPNYLYEYDWTTKRIIAEQLIKSGYHNGPKVKP